MDPNAHLMSDEQALVARAQAGDRSAFSELVRQHRSGVVNVVYRICWDMALAEDAAQEAFIQAWTHLGDYRPRSVFRNWLYRIATNRALNMVRREKQVSNVDALPLVDPVPGPEQSMARSERDSAIRRAVLALPPASRTVLVLREYEGLSYRDIAETLEIPIGTVMSRLNYARQSLRQSLAEYLEAP